MDRHTPGKFSSEEKFVDFHPGHMTSENYRLVFIINYSSCKRLEISKHCKEK
jgi:hypothetical protein